MLTMMLPALFALAAVAAARVLAHAAPRGLAAWHALADDLERFDATVSVRVRVIEPAPLAIPATVYRPNFAAPTFTLARGGLSGLPYQPGLRAAA